MPSKFNLNISTTDRNVSLWQLVVNSSWNRNVLEFERTIYWMFVKFDQLGIWTFSENFAHI